MAGDPRSGFLFAGGIGVLHVSAHFHNVEGSIAIPGHGDGFVDIWVTEDEFETIAVLEFDGLLGFFDGEKSFLVDGVAGFGKYRKN